MSSENDQPNVEEPVLFTPQRVAEITKKNIQTVWRWIREERIDAENIGTEDRPRYRIAASELDNLTEGAHAGDTNDDG